MKLALTISVAAALLLFIGMLVAARGDNVEDPATGSVALAKRAWLKRQERVHSARFAITRKTVQTKGSATGPRSKEKGKVFPPEDAVFIEPVVIALQGNNLRYEYEKNTWSEEKKAFWKYPYISTRNGDSAKQLFGVNSQGFPQGRVSAPAAHSDLDSIHIYPVTLTYRYSVPELAPFTKLALQENGKAVIDGQECVVFRLVMPFPGIDALLYVDSAREHSIVRYTRSMRGRLATSLDVKYHNDKQFGWVPSSWEIGLKLDASPKYFSERVDDFQINVAMPDNTFDVVFPVGAAVLDERTRPEKKYIVRASGAERRVPREDLTATYDQIVHSEPGHAHDSLRHMDNRWWWWIGSTSVGILAVALWRLFRMRS